MELNNKSRGFRFMQTKIDLAALKALKDDIKNIGEKQIGFISKAEVYLYFKLKKLEQELMH